jgi:3-deoxy-7-phosphoheptulonate synthase
VLFRSVACKIGPGAVADDLIALADKLDPDNEPGRLTFITRMGASRVEDLLPPLLRAMQDEGRDVLWVCDPMHGNTFTSTSGFKTRRFDDILTEIKGFFRAHEATGTVPGGVHLELTADDVTECLGGEVTDEKDLHLRYQALCDPRLNAEQSLDLVFQIGEMLQG